MTLEDARTRVARGAAVLDKQYPDWVDQIDLSTLRLSSACLCIRGQLGHGDWSAAPVQGINGTPAHAEHGFMLPIEMRGKHYREGYALLQQAWTELILARREIEAPVVQWMHRLPPVAAE